jgi:ABC-type Zn uptake system ZnuABC Zn-binding protein ZnuA
MELKMKTLLAFLILFSSGASQAENIRVVTTLEDLADIAQRIGGNRVTVEYIVRGDQNPHFIEIKPSYMMKLRSADIFLMIGMELELWAPQIIDGSRNSKLNVVDLSRNIVKKEIPATADASQGDVHRFGNPHYWLDPRNVRVIADEILESFVKASPADEAQFRLNTSTFLGTLDERIAAWEATMRPYAGMKIITFHRSWTYFTDWVGIEVVAQVEPKPGIQPTPGHTAYLIDMVRRGKIKAIVVEPFYDATSAERIAGSTGAKVVRLATSVGAVSQAKDYLSMMDYNITTLAEALR